MIVLNNLTSERKISKDLEPKIDFLSFKTLYFNLIGFKILFIQNSFLSFFYFKPSVSIHRKV